MSTRALPLGDVPTPARWRPVPTGQRQRKRPARGQLRLVFDRTHEHRNRRARDVAPMVIPQSHRVRLKIADGDRVACGIGRVTWSEDYDAALRPRTRGHCADVPRPCPYVSCQHHLYLDVRSDGALVLNFPDLDPDEMRHECALDVADSTERMGPDEMARVLNLSREKARQEIVAARLRFGAGWERETGEKVPLNADDGPPEMGEMGDIEWSD